MTTVVNHTTPVRSHIIISLTEHVAILIRVNGEDTEHWVISFNLRSLSVFFKSPPIYNLSNSVSILECYLRSVDSILASTLWESLPECDFTPSVPPATIAETFEAAAGRKLRVMIPPTTSVVVDTKHGLHVIVVTHRVNILPFRVQDETVRTVVVDDRLSLLCSELIVLCTHIEWVTSHRHVNC